ncbi:MAG: O-antigen ligase family protein [Actinobacteria bacterium]|nr:O-antigen ligase family protein [Actinomycetota bacterium]
MSLHPLSLLSIYIALLFVLSVRYVVGPLGALGSPATLIALSCALVWIASRTHPGMASAAGLQPVRTAGLLFGWVMLASYAAGSFRPLSALEASGSNRAIVMVAALMGIMLLTADGIETRDQLDRLLQRLVAAAVFLAAIGMVQFASGWDFSRAFHPPGLSLNGDLAAVRVRTVPRVTGTAMHSIEFGVVLAMLLPLAIHYALFPPAEAGFFGRLLRWVAVGLIGFALPLSISRSAVLGLAAAFVTMMAGWSWRMRTNALAAGLVGLVAMKAAVPGVVSTLKSFFINYSNDPSVIGRIDDYGAVTRFIAERPLLGRGIGTFLPDIYRYLDNQYLGVLIESGVLGLLATVGVLLVAVSAARGGRHRSSDVATRNLGQALTAAIAVALLTFATFDALAFAIFAGALFIVLGACGALWRLTALTLPQATWAASACSPELLPLRAEPSTVT